MRAEKLAERAEDRRKKNTAESGVFYRRKGRTQNAERAERRSRGIGSRGSPPSGKVDIT